MENFIMALQKNKMAVEGDTYEIAQAHDAQFKANSEDKDTGKSITWTESEPLDNEEINSNIFNKMSKMFSNVRYLYNELGGSGTITGSSTSIKKKLDALTTGKANKYHEHITNAKSQLPIINTNENSKVYVPSSQLLNTLNVDLFSKVKTKIDIEVYPAYEQYISNPNNREPIKNSNGTYVGKDLGVWSSVSDVDAFCNKYTSANGYAGLNLGDYVTIQDGVFNAQWMIAGFDTEANNGSNNGVGICMIPKEVLGTFIYNTYTRSGQTIYYDYFKDWSYKSPIYVDTGIDAGNDIIYTFLSGVLKTHFVSRNQKFVKTTKRTSGGYAINNKALTTVDLTRYVITLSQRQVYGREIVADTDTYIQYGFDSEILPIFKYISPKVESNIRFLGTRITCGHTLSSGEETTYDFIIPMQYVLRDHVIPNYFYECCDRFHVVVGTNGNPYSMQLFHYYGEGSTATRSANKLYNMNIGMFGFNLPKGFGAYGTTTSSAYWYYWIDSYMSMRPYYSTNFIGMRPSIYIR